MHASSLSLLLFLALALIALFAKAKVPSSDIDTAALATNNIESLTVQGAARADYLGMSVSAAGDVNGDGIDDVIVGAQYENPNGRVDAGAAYVIYGMASGSTTLDVASFVSGARGFIIEGAVAFDYLGISVSGAGDVNG
ncbi:hypothetical protein B484DRAFT_473246, partial [Ochromonadaceae sp. CCMP2298]